MQAIIFALISYFTWGAGDVYGTTGSRKIGGYSTNFWVFLSGIVLFSVYIPFAWHDLAGYTPLLLLFNIALVFSTFRETSVSI